MSIILTNEKHTEKVNWYTALNINEGAKYYISENSSYPASCSCDCQRGSPEKRKQMNEVSRIEENLEEYSPQSRWKQFHNNTK